MKEECLETKLASKLASKLDGDDDYWHLLARWTILQQQASRRTVAVSKRSHDVEPSLLQQLSATSEQEI